MPIVSRRVSCTCTLELFVGLLRRQCTMEHVLLCCYRPACAGALQVAIMLHCLVDSDNLLQVCREADRKQWHFLMWL